MKRESTNHQFVGASDYRLHASTDDERREATISLAARMYDAYPDVRPDERVEIFHDLAEYLALHTDRESLQPIKRLLAGRR